MRKHYERILHDSESRVQRYLDIQILDENSPFCGGFPKADSLAEPKTAIYRATTMTACYLNPESRYYLDAELGRRLALALAFVRRSQRPGGYFDLINCNFFSGPDTAFCTKRLLPAYVYLCKVVDGALPAAPEAKAAAAELKPKYEAIIRDAADALCHCGFHTPNHRWAIASVLMLCAKLFDKPECRTAAEAIQVLPTKVNVAVAAALASIGPDAMGAKITSVEGFSGDDHCITMETDGLKVTSDVYSRTAEIAGWSIVSLLQNLASPVVLF